MLVVLDQNPLIEGMEHHMSPPVLAAMRALTDELKRQPALLRRVQERMASDSD